MSVIRIEHNKQNPYVILNKRALEDKELSWAAKGLWAYLMSRPDDWKVKVSHLATIFEGRGGSEKSIYLLIQELIEQGYCLKSQDRSEGGLFAPVEYIILEFKKVPPLSHLRDADPRDAVNCSHTNKGVIQNKEEQQQQPPVVAVFSVLENLGIAQSEKEWLSKNYDEATVTHAVAWATSPQTKITTTLAQAIKWACKERPEIPKDAEAIIEENRKYAKSLEDKVIANDASYYALNAYAEIAYKAGMMPPVCIKYDSNAFKEELHAALKKYKFQKVVI